MPSAQKQQQQTVVKNGTTTTTTTVITNQSILDNAKFTQAELGTRSFARTVEKNIAEMNKKNGEASTIALSEIKPHEVSHIPDDLTFGSTSDSNQLPQTVVNILAFHNITFSEGDRIIHIPGAKYFSISKMEGEVKTYRTFSLDEDITPRETIIETETISTPTIEEIPTPEIPTVSNDTQVLTVDSNSTVSQNISPVVSQNIPTNTLGTINVLQSAESLITKPDVPENFMSSFAPDESVSPQPVEPVPQPAVHPVVEIPITTRIPIVSQTVVSETVELPLHIKLEQARRASNRERDAYFANRYINSITGTITELFGGNTLIKSELFKTVQDYDAVRRSVLIEMGTQKKSFHEVVSWVKQEQIQIAHLFSHQKSQLFMKLAKVFHLSVPSIIETRTGVTPMVSQTTVSVIGNKLGLVQQVDTTPGWNYLFNTERPVKLDFTKTAIPTITPIVAPIQGVETEIPPVSTEVQKKIDRKKLYNSLHTIMGTVWGINKKSEPTQTSVVNETVHEPIVSEQIVVQEKQKDVSRPMAAISFDPEPEEEVVVDMNSPMKQHPEELFI